MAERGLAVDQVTIWRWVQQYAPLLNQRLRRELRRSNRSWRVDETYVNETAGNQRGRTPGICPRDCRIEAIRGIGPTLPLPAFTLFLNNIIEQDHRFIKKRITASLGFR